MVNSTETTRGFMLAVVLIVSTILALLYVFLMRERARPRPTPSNPAKFDELIHTRLRCAGSCRFGAA